MVGALVRKGWDTETRRGGCVDGSDVCTHKDAKDCWEPPDQEKEREEHLPVIFKKNMALHGPNGLDFKILGSRTVRISNRRFQATSSVR